MSDVAAGADAPESVDTGAAADEGAQGGGNPFAEQFASMENRIMQRLDERFPADPESEADGSITDHLYGDPNFEDMSDGDMDEYAGYYDDYGDDYGDEPSAEDQIREMIREHVSPLQEALLAREQMDAIARIDALQEKYPDLKTDPKVQGAVVKGVESLAQKYGNEAMKLDPDVVEFVYKAVKADAVSASEVPAESAAQGEVSLETGTGPSQSGDTDPDDEIRKAILARSNGGDPF